MTKQSLPHAFATVLRLGSVIALFVLSACTETTTSPGDGSKVWKAPGVSSTYTYQFHKEDLNGNVLDGSDATLLATVTAGGITHHGKAGAVAVAEDTATNYYAYDDSSRIAYYQDSISITPTFAIPGTWVLLPDSSSRNKTILYGKDTTLEFPGAPFPLPTTITAEIEALPSETITVGAEKLRTSVSKMAVVVDVGGGAVTTNVYVTRYYSHQIGFFAQEVTRVETNTPLSPRPPGVEVKVLTSYVKK